MKIVLTGMGAVSAAGAGVPRFVHATDGWRTALVPAGRFAPHGLPIVDVGAVPDDALAGEPDDDRALRIALPAVVEALRSAAIRPGETARRVDLLLLGTSLGGMETALALQRVANGSTEPARPWMQAGYHGLATTLAARLHLRAQVATYNSTCSSGLVALLLAAERIRRGEARLAVVGGVDALSPFAYAGFHALGALATGRCAPWDSGSTGMALADGAGFVVIESDESAEERGAPMLAEILGVASTNDAHHLIAPHPEGRGLAAALELALQEAALPASALGLVVGHGVGTPQGDFAELRALAYVLGGERTITDRVPLTSWKGAVGHPLAAAGILSVIRAVAALKAQKVPPIVGLRHPVATFPVRLPKEPEPLRSHVAAVLASGLGGQASAAVIRWMVPRAANGDASEAQAAFAPARAPARPHARPLRMMRDEVAIVGAALATKADLVGISLAEFEQLNPAMSLGHLPEEGQLAYLAVKGALREAGELIPPGRDVALVAGVGLESLPACARFARPLQDGVTPPSPSLFAYTAANAIAAAVSASFGFRGLSITAASGSFASAQALLDAALILAEGQARRAVVFAFAPQSEELERCVRAAGFGRAERAADATASLPPIAAALVLARIGDANGEAGGDAPARPIALELRRRKRSSVTAPAALPALDPLLGAQAVVEVAHAARRLRDSGGPALPLRALDPCSGAALWMRVRGPLSRRAPTG
jgi:3-oxoacyl-(acyl-carrier-protein) synthase